MSTVARLMVATGAVLLFSLLRAKAVRSLLLSAVGGLAGLYAVSSAAALAVNAFTVCVAAVLGLPGVVSLLLLRMIAVG